MILVDTGVFVAAADRDETEHRPCGELLRTRQGLAVTAPVIPEAAWILETRFGPAAESRFLRLVTSDRFDIVDLNAGDYRCVIDLIDLIDRYADLGLGLVDASIIAAAQRLDVVTVATLNHRDFAVVRPSHTDALDLIP